MRISLDVDVTSSDIMVTLDNGDVIAVCTTEEVNKLGIEDGTVITKWNGKPVKQAVEEDVREMGFPVQENEDIIEIINLSGVGGDTVEVAFKDKSGKEQTVTLKDLGEMHTLRETVNTFTHISDEEEGEEEDKKMLNDTCGFTAKARI